MRRRQVSSPSETNCLLVGDFTGRQDFMWRLRQKDNCELEVFYILMRKGSNLNLNQS